MIVTALKGVSDRVVKTTHGIRAGAVLAPAVWGSGVSEGVFEGGQSPEKLVS